MGNSLALRIPKSFANEVGLESNALVELALVNGQLVVTPVSAPSVTLDDLLAGVTAENINVEVDTGSAVGNEVW